ncbi:hypothetical protein ElyMa_001178200 [Elysia marginata]|uniref:BESS domain-containing protein n=1 Tax=Elysia marginata TaxID=1093978 RepID=A0AAV4I1V0_9GAST|nr:hypothetical protein ElyMa_001178200 [Elysia marginata]
MPDTYDIQQNQDHNLKPLKAPKTRHPRHPDTQNPQDTHISQTPLELKTPLDTQDITDTQDHIPKPPKISYLRHLKPYIQGLILKAP